jgi:hypothetical protein
MLPAQRRHVAATYGVELPADALEGGKLPAGPALFTFLPHPTDSRLIWARRAAAVVPSAPPPRRTPLRRPRVLRIFLARRPTSTPRAAAASAARRPRRRLLRVVQSAGAALKRLLQSVAPPAPRIFGRMSSATRIRPVGAPLGPARLRSVVAAMATTGQGAPFHSKKASRRAFFSA